MNSILKEYVESSPKYPNLAWLKPLSKSTERIADFGCWKMDEPLILLYLLDANEIAVIEKQQENLTKPKDDLASLRKSDPVYFKNRIINFIEGDMTNKIDKLPSNYFNLAYCNNVLYLIYSDLGIQGLQDAINEMIRVVKPQGYIIAHEPRIGADFETVSIPGFPPIPTNQKIPPMDIGSFFTSAKTAKLEQYILANAPDHSYCYQKFSDY